MTNAFTTWGSVGDYCLAHSEFGTDLRKDFGPRPAISWTTDLPTAQRFAGKFGYVLKARVRIDRVMNTSWTSSTESEVLIRNGVWAQFHSQGSEGIER